MSDMSHPVTTMSVFVMVREKKRLLVSLTGSLNDTKWIPRKLIGSFNPPGEPRGWTTIAIPTVYATRKFMM